MEAKKFSVIVLAGGKSRRMGQDKAALPWRQSDLLGSLLERLSALSEDIVVVSNTVRDIPQPIRQVADSIPGKGPLSGIHAGLLCAYYDLAFVTACDVPFLVPEIVPKIVGAVGQADGSVVVYKEQIEPLFACYHKRCAAVIEELLEQQQYRVKDFLKNIHWVPVRGLDNIEDDCFMNVNTAYDYELAREILAKERCL